MTAKTDHSVLIRSIGTLHEDALDLVGDGLYFDLGNRIRNPHEDPAMREKTGLDPEVREHVLATVGARMLSRMVFESVKMQLFASFGERQEPVMLTLACRGGRHRSVAMAEHVAERLRGLGVSVQVEHRHIGRPVVQPSATTTGSG